jgi:predicted alpha/beta hydrolase
MYDFVLLAHSWLRWLVLLAGLAALARAFTGVNTRRPLTMFRRRRRHCRYRVLFLNQPSVSAGRQPRFQPN